MATSPQTTEKIIVDGSGSSEVIPVVEEQLHVGKRVVESGRVIITKRVHHEEQQIDVPLVHEEIEVERVVINQQVETPPAVRYEGETMIIPVLREEVEIRKRLVLVEEIRISKRQVESMATEPVTLRKEEVVIERRENEQFTNE